MEENIFVDQRVLIPRPETEVLVDTIKSLNLSDGSILCDLGTGSGCIGISLAMLNESFIVFGVDISEEAILVARENDLTYIEKKFLFNPIKLGFMFSRKFYRLHNFKSSIY